MSDRADAGQGVKRESKFALPTGFLVTVLTNAALGGLTGIDTSQMSGWWVPVLSTAIGTAVAWLTAYKTKNVKPSPYA